MICRDVTREASWLAGASRDAGAPGFAEHATRRLAAGERVYGSTWATLGVARLLAELAEEAADLGAWGVLALQALERDADLSDIATGAVANRVRGAMLAGARAHRELALASQELHTHAAAPARRRFLPDVDGRCINCGGTYGVHIDLRCPERRQ